MPIELTLFTDPVCPFAFSAEPARWRLRWHYGDAISWRLRMIVLTREEGEAELLAEGAPGLQRVHGMPIDPSPYARPFSSEPACLAVVAARLFAPAKEEALLRQLRVRVMTGGLADDPALLADAARGAGLEPGQLAHWCGTREATAALDADAEAARSPSPSARALDHKLGGPASERRYTAPSYELTGPGGGASVTVPGFNPVEAYEVAIAAISPKATRRPKPRSVDELLAWAGEPLATAEVALTMGLELTAARVALSKVATPRAAGADFYWEPSS